MKPCRSQVGRVHSFQSLGAVDGPGLRYVVFLQGCPLRCGYCHNPDTWDLDGGTFYTAQQIVDALLRYRPYFGRNGGVTVTGGEPLMQSEFVRALFALCHAHGVHTCLDTSGCALNDGVRALLDETDHCLLDIKFTNDLDYRRHTRGSLRQTRLFLEELQRRHLPTWIRQVIVPQLNDTAENVQALNALIAPYTCITRVELLPFHKLCTEKYDRLGLPFPFARYPAATQQCVDALQSQIVLPQHT